MSSSFPVTTSPPLELLTTIPLCTRLLCEGDRHLQHVQLKPELVSPKPVVLPTPTPAMPHISYLGSAFYHLSLVTLARSPKTALYLGCEQSRRFLS